VLGTWRPLVHHPVWLMKCASFFLQALPGPPLTPAAIDFITMETLVDPKPAEALFGLRFVRFEDGLRRYLSPEIRSQSGAVSHINDESRAGGGGTS
jgi:hypothetical protein